MNFISISVLLLLHPIDCPAITSLRWVAHHIHIRQSTPANLMKNAFFALIAGICWSVDSDHLVFCKTNFLEGIVAGFDGLVDHRFAWFDFMIDHGSLLNQRVMYSFHSHHGIKPISPINGRLIGKIVWLMLRIGGIKSRL